MTKREILLRNLAAYRIQQEDPNNEEANEIVGPFVGGPADLLLEFINDDEVTAVYYAIIREHDDSQEN